MADQDRRTLTHAQREARKIFRDVKMVAPISEADAAKEALLENRDRLKAERLAREAQTDQSND